MHSDPGNGVELTQWSGYPCSQVKLLGIMESYTLRVKLQVMQNKSQEHGITHPGVGSAVAGREVETRWRRIHWESVRQVFVMQAQMQAALMHLCLPIDDGEANKSQLWAIWWQFMGFIHVKVHTARPDQTYRRFGGSNGDVQSSWNWLSSQLSRSRLHSGSVTGSLLRYFSNLSIN